jgi:hypothetical protein
MFEGNFRVDKGMCSYPVLWNALKRIAAAASAAEKAAPFHLLSLFAQDGRRFGHNACAVGHRTLAPVGLEVLCAVANTPSSSWSLIGAKLSTNAPVAGFMVW